MNKKFKKRILTILLVIFSFVLILYGYWAYRYYINEADTLIILSNKSNIDTVDIKVFIDGTLAISDDVLKYELQGFKTYKRRLNFGFHNIEIRSSKDNAVLETKIFCYYIHYVVIEFFNDSTVNFSDNESESNNFIIRKSILPFRPS